MKTGVFLLLGTNIGDGNANLVAAIKAIQTKVGLTVKRSSIYKTAAWGKTDQPPFLNQVIEIQTSLSPQKVLDELLAIEEQMGRKRSEKWSERIIDIDILFYGEEIIESRGLAIPHPQIALRRFTLVPLNEIVPMLMHPKLAKRIHELLADCPDQLSVARVSES